MTRVVPVPDAPPTTCLAAQMDNIVPHEAPLPVTAASSIKPEAYTQPFLRFISQNPTVFHAVAHFSKQLSSHGFTKLSERVLWTDKLEKGGKYFYDRNGSGLVVFTVGSNYKPGNGIAIIASHIDALSARLKPISAKSTKAGFVQLGIAPYAGGLNQTWIDRDLSVGGRVFVKDEKSIATKLVKLDWPIARIPSLAPHFGIPAQGQANKETRMVPIIGLDNSDIGGRRRGQDEDGASVLGGAGTFVSTQPERLVKAIAGEMGIQDYSSIVNWELEVFDTQPAQLGGLDKEFIFAGRIDDKLCSFSAIEALLASSCRSSTEAEGIVQGGGAHDDSGIIKMVGLFDDEEVGSLLRQGARSNFLPITIERICEAFAGNRCGANILAQTYANSFLVSADVTHAVNPNYLDVYLEDHSPRLNVGIAVAADSNAHMTTDGFSTALLQRVAEKSSSVLQVFQIRNDSRSGGTVGPMLSSMTGIRAIDAGLPQLSIHSIRATTGSLDPGLGVKLFAGFFDHFETIDAEFV
ncbi:hypothetical protein MMC13_004451 [Lambiella insularis]|nr:hypothetical protein [Lambiella insularis]